jgi:kynurenine 3-monooxygenase
MSDFSDRNITIVGAGLGGALMANFLARAGARVDVYERRHDPRTAGVIGGRSINLAISARGIDALRRVGLADEIMRQAIPMRGRMIHGAGGALSFQPYDKDPARCINSISRGGLNLALIEAAERHENVRVHFGHRCSDVDLGESSGTPSVRFVSPPPRAANRDGAPAPGEAHSNSAATGIEGSAESISVASDLIIGADGAFSAVRGAMQRLDRFDYRQDYLGHGYKELTIPPNADGSFRMNKNALHIWPRRAFMMIALPNPDGSFTCTLFWPFAGPNSFANLRTDDDVRGFFMREFADAVPLMPTLVEDYQRNPTSSLVTVRCHPWHVGGSVALLGDAAHAIVPFYGQGMNAGFEDCVALDRCLREHAQDWSAALSSYTAARKQNADAIADLALHNFIEMRDHAGKMSFRIGKSIERVLHRFWPGYTPLYTMVSFTTAPYAEARRRAKRQDLRVRVAVAFAFIVALAAILWMTR